MDWETIKGFLAESPKIGGLAVVMWYANDYWKNYLPVHPNSKLSNPVVFLGLLILVAVGFLVWAKKQRQDAERDRRIDGLRP
ncbi:MAG: hypothetical protein ABIJ96_08420 [Elusimicrobiota bacterium]